MWIDMKWEKFSGSGDAKVLKALEESKPTHEQMKPESMGEGAPPQFLTPHSLSEAEINHYDKNMLTDGSK